MSDTVIEVDVEVEDPAWSLVPGVEEVVARAATATVQILLRGKAPEEGDHARHGGGGGAGGSQASTDTGADFALRDRPTAGAAPSTASRSPSPALRAEEELAVTILLADDEVVADLNQRFRGKAGPTNVLSFPAPANPLGHMGDIALAYGVCAREAAEQGKALSDHLSHLVVHGLLHLAGYDHQTDDEAQVMEDLERLVLAGLNISDPYRAAE
jgi:probable rRNA maturation factor